MAETIDSSNDSADQPLSQELNVEAVQHFQQGKRYMILNDIQSALPCFEEAVKLFDLHYGTGAPECGEAYMNYGIALYEATRLDDTLIEGALNNEEVDGNDNESEGDEEGDEEADQPQNGNELETNGQNQVQADKPTDDHQPGPSNSHEPQPSTSSGVVASSGEAEAAAAAEEDASNMEIAWEVLNLAKDIFTEQDTRDSQLNLAETLLKLGEIAMEWENCVQSVAFLNESLELRKQLLSPDDRLIAEVYHALGLAFQLNSDLDKSISCFENVHSIIKLRLDNLKAKSTDGLSQFEKDARVKEITQLGDILPDTQAKIDDLKDQMQSKFQTKKALEQQEQEQEKKKEEEKEKLSKALPAKPTNDISHLIKRKREEDGDDKAEACKKTCNETAKKSVQPSSSSLSSPSTTTTTTQL